MIIRLTSQDYWISAFVAFVFSCVLIAPLILVFRNLDFKQAAWSTGIASALFWGSLAIVAFYAFWEIYYQYIFPQWMRKLAPADFLLYAAIGLGMWWLATQLPGSAVLWFVFFGGIESIVEHLIGIYWLGILDKVPVLQQVDPLPALIFAFFEYMVYWSLIAWFSLFILKVFQLWRGV